MGSTLQRQSENYVGPRKTDKQEPFFIVALPRSGTAWLANFLTWEHSHCFHEGLFGCESLDRYEDLLYSVDVPFVGNSDTGAIYLLPAIYDRFPSARYIFVVRDIKQIYKSLNKLKLPSGGLFNMADCLWWGIKSIPGSLVVTYETMFNQITLRKIWSHIGLPDPFPWQRCELLRNMHVEDGYGSGFGRFTDKELLEENREKFQMLMESVALHDMTSQALGVQ